MERWRDFIITLLTIRMSLTDVYILTEKIALCHKTIILNVNNNKSVSIGSIEYARIIYNSTKPWSRTYLAPLTLTSNRFKVHGAFRVMIFFRSYVSNNQLHDNKKTRRGRPQ